MNRRLKDLCRIVWGSTGQTYREIAEVSGLPKSAIGRIAREDHWKDHRRTIQEQGAAGRPVLQEALSAVRKLAMGNEVQSDGEAVARLLDCMSERCLGAQTDTVGEVTWSAPDPSVPEAVIEETDRLLAADRGTPKWVSDAQRICAGHFELFEAFNQLVRGRLNIVDGHMEDPGVLELPASDIKVLLECATKIQEGQRKSMGLDKAEAGAGGGQDILVEYTNLRTKLGDTAEKITVSGGDVLDRAQALEFAFDVLRKQGVAVPVDVAAGRNVEDEIRPLDPHVLEAMAAMPEPVDYVDPAPKPVAGTNPAKSGVPATKRESQDRKLSGLD